MKKFISILLLAILSINLTGCNTGSSGERIVIYTTNYTQKFILNSIGRDYVSVYSIYDNVDTYEPGNEAAFEYKTIDPSEFTFSDNPEKLEAVLKADLFIYNGRSQNDYRVLKELIEADEDEELTLFDTTRDAKRSFIAGKQTLSYDGKAVDNKIMTLLSTEAEREMYWLSPIETMNVTGELYDKLEELLPNQKDELKKNYDDLMYDLTDLYATIEDVRTDHLNNMFVSDSIHLNTLDVHYLQNIYTDHTSNTKHKGDETNVAYLNEISTFVTINEGKLISTKDKNQPNYFDLLEVQSADDFALGLGYFEIMRKNYELINTILD